VGAAPVYGELVTDGRLLCRHLWLRPTSRLVYNGAPGIHLHAALLNVLREVDPEGFRVAHTPNSRRSFAFGPLLLPDNSALRPGNQCTPRETLRCRIGSAEPRFSAALEQELRTGRRLQLGGSGRELTNWELVEWEPEPGIDGLTYRELLHRTGSGRELELDLLSPTFFRLNKVGESLLPDPERLFRGLAQCWESLPIGQAVPLAISSTTASAQVRSAVRVSALDLITGEYEARNMHRGVVGRVSMHIADTVRDLDLIHALNVLLDLTPYVGVGAKTSYGFGQARRAN
jgi:CRISPR-associated endoribonuclease Cas6